MKEEEYMFTLVKPITNGKYTRLSSLKNSIFLAGPCPREDYSRDWRYEAFDILEGLGFTGNVITPTNEQFKQIEASDIQDGELTIEKQIEWERVAMHCASAIVFWVPRSEELPARTTNVEFGEWYKKRNVFIGWPDGVLHNDYFLFKMKEQKKTRYEKLRDILEAVVNALNGVSTSYFTADTHFKQQRTLELSRRPFVDVKEMDLTIISNWNKTVTMNDIVYHAGDFIDPDHLNQLSSLLDTLNFKELHWTLGNYDRKERRLIEKIVAGHIITSGRTIKLYDSGTCRVESPSGRKYVIVHEPNDFEYDRDGDEIFLFGHIHGRSFAKRNGFDLASDYHRYTPLSLDQVDWFANAMKYWDENVYSEKVNERK